MLEIWLALDGDAEDFEEWIDHPRRTPADAWAQLLAAISGSASLVLDTNPPAGKLLDLPVRKSLRKLRRVQEERLLNAIGLGSGEDT
mgnify:CR=1 FL=1